MTADRSQAEIRDALIRYAAETNEGKPSLAKQIGVEVKILQRFADGTGRINDSLADKVKAFLEVKGAAPPAR